MFVGRKFENLKLVFLYLTLSFVSKLGTVKVECLVLKRHSNWNFTKDYVVVKRS